MLNQTPVHIGLADPEAIADGEIAPQLLQITVHYQPLLGVDVGPIPQRTVSKGPQEVMKPGRWDIRTVKNDFRLDGKGHGALICEGPRDEKNQPESHDLQ